MYEKRSLIRRFLESSLVHELFLSATILVSLFCASLTVLAYVGKPNWVLNLAGHWQMQYFILQLGCYLVLSATKHPRLKFVPLAFAALSLAMR